LSAPINTTAGFAITLLPDPQKIELPTIRRAAGQKNGGTGAKMWNPPRVSKADKRDDLPAYRATYQHTMIGFGECVGVTLPSRLRP
jgi:hypothetical protein